MHITVVAVGKLRPWYQQAADTYLKRLRGYWKVTVVEVKEASSSSTESMQRLEEAKRIAKVLPRNAFTVALAREGRARTSRAVSQEIARWGSGGRALAFVIGGSVGLERELLLEADARWSLGPLTFPHQLARVIVVEQLYRAATMQQGHPYHKGAP